MTAPALPRPAATIVLCRPCPAGFEVLLVKRHGKSGFMAGAHVFPGGRVDAADAAAGAPWMAMATSIVDAASPDEAAAFVAAAVRETREEAGIDVDPATLAPWSWWITPAEEPKRFDTRFFLAAVPTTTAATIDQHEAVHHAWLTPRAALDAYGAGTIVLAPPTLATLEDLAPFRTCEAAAASVRRPLPPICPTILSGDDGMVLTLPGDALHDVKERVFPNRTRFVMTAEGRFRSA